MPLSWSTMLCTGEFFLCSVATSKHTKVLLLYVLEDVMQTVVVKKRLT